MMVNHQFSETDHAEIYSAFRPDIPSKLAEESVSFLKEKFHGALDTAVDVGCGSGQSTVICSPFFNRVHGFDVSEAQIQEAKVTRPRQNVLYTVSEAESLPFEDGSVQLVTAGASLHWLDRGVFFGEVRRILANHGVFVAYTYHSVRPVLECPLKTKEADLLYNQVYEELHPYWPQEVHISLDKYRSVHFPFEEVYRAPDVRQVFDGRISDLIGFVESFSAFQNMKKVDATKADIFITEFHSRLRELLLMPNELENPTIKLYRDFYSVMCRKGVT